MSQIFEIQIREELARVEKIEAKTLGEAIDKAMDLYYSGKTVLDAEDIKGVDFTQMKEDEEEEQRHERKR